MNNISFDDMVEMCRNNGEPLQLIVKTRDGYQVSLKSKYSGNSYVVDIGATPTEALVNIMKQRRIILGESNA